ncbi:MAG: MotA/TolQ/ExbB proton channel family protein [Pseudomonadales bacterium]|nr:MotA/TolQ/ExbB proton channel family protein [Pseudomonadales bacterium]
MIDFILAGGIVMYPIILCSILALAIIGERLWSLRSQRITPSNLSSQVWGWVKSNQLDAKRLKQLRDSSPLGRILAMGLLNSKHGRDIMKESIVDTASHEIHEMGRFLNLLGSIAAITPLLGLLGTVIGMIKVFNAIVMEGTGNAAVLAGGISEALYTTAAGLAVAIPALFFHRFFSRRIDEIAILMEQEAVKLVDVLHGDRESDADTEGKVE